MIRASARIGLEVVAVLVAGLLLAVAFGVWRLSQSEPVRLGFLTPYLEQALHLPDKGISVKIGETRLTWAGWSRTFDLNASDVTIIDADGTTLAEVPEISVTLSVRALLLRGLVAPTAIEIVRPKILLLREVGGRFHFGRALVALERIDPSSIPDSQVLPAFFDEFVHERDRSKAASYLRRATIRDADLTLIDRERGVTWHAPSADFSFERQSDGLTGRVSLSVTELGQAAQFDGDVVYLGDERKLTLDARFSGVDVATLGLIHSKLIPLAGSDLMVEGSVSTILNLDGRLGAVAFDIAGGPGLIDLPGIYPEKVPVQRVAVTGRLDNGYDTLSVGGARLDLGGLVIAMNGSITGLESVDTPRSGSLRIAVDIGIQQVTMANLQRYWPQGVGENVRQWVTTRIPDGAIEGALAKIDLRLPGGANASDTTASVSGSMTGKGLTIHYLDPLPPLTGVDGTATFTEKGLDAAFTTGRIDGIAIEGGTLAITDFDKPTQFITVAGTARAELVDALKLLDHPRLGYASALGIDPASASGSSITKLSFSFPAAKDLPFEQVTLTANSSILNAAIRKVAFGQDLNDGNFTLDLDGKGMTLEGTGRIAGIASAVRWIENFEPAAFQRELTLSGTVDAEQRAALGIDMRPTVDGPIGMNLVYSKIDDSRGQVEAKLDLAATIVDLPFLGWKKTAPTGGFGHVVLALGPNDSLGAIEKLEIDAGGLVATGSGRLAAVGKGVDQLTLDRFRLGGTDLSATTIDFTGGRPEIVIGGGTVDAEPVLASEAETPPIDSAAATPPPEEEKQQPFKLTAERLDRVLLDPDRVLQNVRLVLDHSGDYWERLELDATLDKGSSVMLRYVPVEGQRHELKVEASDAGAALRLLKIIDDVRGGTLAITGEADDNAPSRPLTGKAEINDFRLVNQPALGRLLSIATLTGLIDALTGEGFLFQRFVGSFTKTDGRLDIPSARAHGPSLGLTATGWLDEDTDQIEFSGTIVPAYGINSLLGNIPIIGDLLQGGEGQGLFAATYRATGKLSEPSFSVNPLAALAPGFLRGLFDIFEGGSGPPKEPPPLPEPGDYK